MNGQRRCLSGTGCSGVRGVKRSSVRGLITPPPHPVMVKGLSTPLLCPRAPVSHGGCSSPGTRTALWLSHKTTPNPLSRNACVLVQVHGDVFRAPKHLMLFSALHGTGCQVTVLVFAVILFAIAGPLHGDVYEERGEIVATVIVCYALTSFVAG